jgi:hypothetical protein
MKFRKTANMVALFGAGLLALTLIALVYADSKAINFESPAYHTGTINLQQGWAGTNGIPILATIDQEIVTNGSGVPASFGAQSWRFSSAWQDGQFGQWPFSPSLTNEAGESAAANDGYSGGVRQPHYEVQFSFTSAAPSGEQVGLQMSTASDRGDGARMSYIRLEDRPSGLAVVFGDYEDVAPFGTSIGDTNGCDGADDFILTTVASGLSRGDAHTVKLTIDFVSGPRNDVVNVYVDGALVHTGTSWEDYFRYCEGNPTRTVDSQIFQARSNPAATNLAVLGKGFLIDNLSYGSGRPPANANQCKNGGWANYTRGDGSTFKNQGDCIQYVNTGK